ncbi:MAG: anion permease, partial [Angelakisella sp.]
PLGSTFWLIALTDLFSRGISNSKIAEKFLEPMLFRFADTPLKVMMFAAAILMATMYIIPQPLARLIIIADIIYCYLHKTDAPKKTKEVLMFSVFVAYVFVNSMSMKADIILNTTAVSVSGLEFTDANWISYMAVPSLIYLAVAYMIMLVLFKKDLWKISLTVNKSAKPVKFTGKMSGKDWQITAIIAVTVLMWMTESMHGIAAWLVTLVSISVMFALGILKKPDLKALDVNTLLFLTAAMSIGGTMKATGTADVIFSQLGSWIPSGSSMVYVIVIMVISVCMHMFLGSNTTTISVVVPGLIMMCGDVVPPAIIMCIIYITLATQWLFPFHSVGMMVGTSRKYFPSGHMLKMGIPMTIIVFLAVIGLYLPWWHMMGYLG